MTITTMAPSGDIDKVFGLGPVFHAEPSLTSRHATEFTGINVELASNVGVRFSLRLIRRQR